MPNRVQATDRGVFINCPFDPEYKEHLNVLLFTVCDGGFSPRIAFESADLAGVRGEVYPARPLRGGVG
jgi:hypothetical protein